MNENDERIDRSIMKFIEDGQIDAELQPHSEALQALRGLEQVPDLDSERAHSIRQRYLDRVDTLQPAVSPGRKSRLNGWMSIFRKERSPMFTVARIITITAILLGGTTGTAFAAQASLPDQALYPVKTMLEDVRLGLATDPQSEFDLLMALIEERFNEIQTMAQKGEPIGDAVQLRLENHLRAAFQNAAELDDPGLIQAMEKVRQQSQNQLKILNQFKQGTGSESETNLDLAEQAIIRSRIQAEGALENPNTLRTRYGPRRNLDAPDQPEMLPPGEGQGEPADGDSNGAGPSGAGEGNDGEPGPRRNGQSQ